jgi:hypothetical protein
LKQPDPSILILEAHVHANPKPKVTWLCNGDFVKESDRKTAKLEQRPGEKNKWNATLTILVRMLFSNLLVLTYQTMPSSPNLIIPKMFYTRHKIF